MTTLCMLVYDKNTLFSRKISATTKISYSFLKETIHAFILLLYHCITTDAKHTLAANRLQYLSASFPGQETLCKSSDKGDFNQKP
jgi:hypothetical protein